MATSATTAAARQEGQTERVELILSQLEQLPTLPAVAVRVLQATTSAETDASDVVALIRADQSLTAKVLSLVQCSSVGAARNVTDLSRAVVLLGFSAVRNAVLSIQVFETIGACPSSGEDALNRTEFWKHSLAVACASQLIARESKSGVQPDEAFVCGLLHDLGKVALDVCLPKSYARIVKETELRQACICDVEKKLLGLDHTVAGKRLAKRWKLPEAVVECIWLHHQPPQTLPASLKAPKQVQIVHLADHIVRRQRIGYSGYSQKGDITALAAELGIGPDALEHITSAIAPEVEEHCGLVGLTELTSADLYADALGGANKELALLNSNLTSANRRLEVRSRCFDALQEFHGSLSAQDTLLDVCRVGAVCAKSALGLQREVVCFGLNQLKTICHLAGSTVLAGDSAVLAWKNETLIPAAPGNNLLVALPSTMESIVGQFDYLAGDEPIWLMSAGHDTKLVGGFVFQAPADVVEQLGAYPQELNALAGAVGLAVVTASVRSDSELLIEELADVNRRLSAAQDEALRSKSLRIIARMAAGAAHELNNPLAVISGRAQMLARGLIDENDVRSVTLIREQAQQASDIVSELLDFAKPEVPDSQTVSLQPWLEKFRAKWLKNSTLREADFELCIANPGIAARVDPDQLLRIFDALIANAVEAMTSEKPRLLINSASSPSDDTIVVMIEDNGVGMSPEVLEHAPDPFFSHRQAGRGRGLGLSRAHSLATRNGGRLWLESTEGGGSRAFVEFPSARMG